MIRGSVYKEEKEKDHLILVVNMLANIREERREGKEDDSGDDKNMKKGTELR